MKDTGNCNLQFKDGGVEVEEELICKHVNVLLRGKNYERWTASCFEDLPGNNIAKRRKSFTIGSFLNENGYKINKICA